MKTKDKACPTDQVELQININFRSGGFKDKRVIGQLFFRADCAENKQIYMASIIGMTLFTDYTREYKIDAYKFAGVQLSYKLILLLEIIYIRGGLEIDLKATGFTYSIP